MFSLLVGVLLIARRDLYAVAALCFLAAAVLGLSAVVMNLISHWFYWLFPAALMNLGLGVIILSVMFIFSPGKLLTKFPPAVRL